MPRTFLKFDLDEPEVFEVITFQFSKVILFDQVERAFVFQKNIQRAIDEDQELASRDKSLFDRYNQLLAQARFVALPLLTEDVIEDLFREQFIEFFNIQDFEIEKKLIAKLANIPLYVDRDQFRNRLSQSLLDNKERLTKGNLEIDGQEKKSTVSEWKKFLNINLGSKPVGKVALSQFLAKNKNIQNLDDGDKKNLKKFISLLELLKQSSITREGLEDIVFLVYNDKLTAVDHGTLLEVKGRDVQTVVDSVMNNEEFDEMPARQDIRESIVEKIAKKKEERHESVATATERWSKEPDLIGALHNALKPPPTAKRPTPDDAIAIIRLLSEKRQLEQVLRDNRFIELMNEQFRKKGKEAWVEGFRINPTAPQFVTAFLRYVLEDTFHLPEESAASEGSRLAGVLQKLGVDSKYMGMAYFDASTNKFTWSK